MKYLVPFAFLMLSWIGALWMMWRASKGIAPHVRHIAAFDAFDNAIGRASEMGRPVHFTTGYGGGGLYTRMSMDHMAGLSILSYVAKKSAEMETKVIVTLAFAEMIPIAEDIIRNAGIAAGKPDYYQVDMIRYTVDNSEAYDALAMSVIPEEKCAANFVIGAVDSLNAIVVPMGGIIAGAINIGGVRGSPAALIPYCDFVMFGEEMPVAGAMIAEDIDSVSSIVSSDYAKLLTIIIIIVGSVMATLGLSTAWINW